MNFSRNSIATGILLLSVCASGFLLVPISVHAESIPAINPNATCNDPQGPKCGNNERCQQNPNSGFYECVNLGTSVEPDPSATCHDPAGPQCGSGTSCQQGADGFYGCYPSGQCGDTGSACTPPQVCQLGSCTTPGGTPGTATTPGSGGTGGINTTYLKGYSDSINSIINTILAPLLISVAFIFFLWGIYKYFILGAASSDDHKEGAQFLMWSIIGFVIIFSLWGLVSIVGQTLGLPAGQSASGSGLHTPTL